jgi:hypothetical protein
VSGRRNQGLLTLADLALSRPLVREACLRRLLPFALHEKKEIRELAINSAIVKRYDTRPRMALLR